MKNRTVRILAAALAAIFMVLMLPIGASAVNLIATNPSQADEGYEYTGWSDIPLLVIKINYRPEGADPTLIKTTDDTYWYEMLFGDGEKSMKSFFETASDGNFRFTPAKENYVNESHKNVANDGIVEVTVNTNHPGGTNRGEVGAAIAAAAEFVDFKSFDVDGSGSVEKDELAIAFVCAGYEATRSTKTPNNHAFYLGATLTAGGISMSGGYIKVGEMMSDTTPLTVGTFCHELSHYLGTVDLYTSKSWGGANSPAGKVSVMAGNGSSGKNTGEATGESPSYLDPFHLTALGFYPSTTIVDGEYTLYSRQSTEGKYNILKIETPNPNEYYLIENRYFDNSSAHFDSETNYDGTRGIIIWHVDETYATPFGSGGNNGADIGVAALAPRREGADPVFPANSGVFGVKGQVFNCEDYAFPWSGTWHTTLGEVWNDFFQLKIEILTDAGHEMKIKVTGTKTADFPTDARGTVVTSDSLTMRGQITDTKGQTLTGVTLQISDKYDYSNILSSIDVQVDADGKYAGIFDSLTSKTFYYTRVVYHFEEGDFYYDSDATTKNPVDPTVCLVSFFRALTENDKAFEQKVAVGEPIVVKFPMNKTGYVFAGWYTDPELTQYYEVSNPSEAGELVLYAKWVEADKAAQLIVKGATLVNDKVNPAGYAAVGETFREPVVTAQEGKKVVWYADEACTTPFDFSKTVDSTDAVTIYAKYEDDIPEETDPPVTTPEETTADTADTTAPNEETPSGLSTGAIVAIIAVVVVIVVVAVVLVVVRKKKK